jgi:hypothetical protein
VQLICKMNTLIISVGQGISINIMKFILAYFVISLVELTASTSWEYYNPANLSDAKFLSNRDLNDSDRRLFSILIADALAEFSGELRLIYIQGVFILKDTCIYVATPEQFSGGWNVGYEFVLKSNKLLRKLRITTDKPTESGREL